MAKQHYFFSTTENFTKPLVKKPAIQDTVKQYTENNVNVNADKEREGETGVEEGKTDLRKLPNLDQPKEKTKLIAQDICHELGDKHSQGCYYLVAAKVPEHVIRQALADIKHGGARFPARVFTSRMKDYVAQKIDIRLQSLQSAMQGMQKRMTFH